MLVLSSRRSGGSSLGFRAGSLSALGQKHAKRLNMVNTIRPTVLWQPTGSS